MDSVKLSYSIRCRNCRYSRIYGYARITAECKATAHALRKGHNVDITVTDLERLESHRHAVVAGQKEESEEVPF